MRCDVIVVVVWVVVVVVVVWLVIASVILLRPRAR